MAKDAKAELYFACAERDTWAPLDVVAQRLDVADGHERARRRIHHAGNAAGGRAHHRQSARHRFRHRHPEAFVARWQHEDVGGVETGIDGRAIGFSGALFVVSGDTLRKIAAKYNTTPAELMKLNKISTPDQILLGTKIKVPKQH